MQERPAEAQQEKQTSTTRQSSAVGDLSRIFDTNQDGEIADDIARIGSSIVGGMFGRDATT